ncbi:MAG: nucleotidyltransferase family protein [Acidobacteriota bacterium]
MANAPQADEQRHDPVAPGTAVVDRLLDCLHQDPRRTELTLRASLAVAEWEAVFALARAHTVDALLAFRLRSRGGEDTLPAAVRQAAADARRSGMRSGLLVRETLTRLTTALQNGGVRVIVLKGAHLAHIVYPDPSLRAMTDVDLLVGRTDLGRAAALLRANGCHQVAASDDDGPLADFTNHLPRFYQALPPAVELHWKLAPSDPATRTDHWHRAVPVRLAGVDTLGLCPEDLLLLVCAHACYSHRFMFGIRPICDVAEIVRHFGGTMVWADVVERARQHRSRRGVYLMLRLAREMLGAAVPDDVLRALSSDRADDAIRTARFMILEGHRICRQLPAPIVTLSSATGWPGRLRLLLRSLFPSPDRLAAHYGLPARSPTLPFYYVVRLKDLLKRHGTVVRRVLRRDAALTPIARDMATVEDWLSKEAGI